MVPESCSLVLEGNTASEVYERDLAGQSWNLITLPEGRSPSDLEDRIENTDGVSIGDWQGEKYWTNMGGEWDHPYSSLDNDRPFYVWVNSETTVDFGESVEDPGPGGDPDDGSDDSDDSDDPIGESPSDCAEDEYYDHGFNTCLPDSDSGDDGDDRSDDSDDSSGSEELDPNDVEWTLNPPPHEWEGYGSDNEVHIEVTARTGGADITGYRIWADLSHDAWVNDPNPWMYVCNEGGSDEWTSCHTDHTHDPYPSEWETYEVTGKLQEETCETEERYSRRRSYEYQDCSWNTIDQHTWNNFPYEESDWDGWY